MDITFNVSRTATVQRRILDGLWTPPARKKKIIAASDAPPDCSILRSGESVTIRGVYMERRRVIDVYRYVIEIDQYGNALPPRSVNGNLGEYRDRPTTEATRPTIVIVIESPHYYEYSAAFAPIAPAQNTTGRLIKRHIQDLINRHAGLGLPPGEYDLIISNPVQFQASLNHFHGVPLGNSAAKAIRDLCWRAIYPHEQEGFHSRLTDYDPEAIIVASTAGVMGEVKSEILRWAQDQGSSARIFKAASHPCWWRASTVLTAVA